MMIKVVKKGSVKVKADSYCDFMVDAVTEPSR